MHNTVIPTASGSRRMRLSRRATTALFKPVVSKQTRLHFLTSLLLVSACVSAFHKIALPTVGSNVRHCWNTRSSSIRISSIMRPRHTNHHPYHPREPPPRFAARNHHHHHPEEDAPTKNSAAPIYITVGTQCCGKTTFLKEQHLATAPAARPPLDISLDDQPDVYVSVETQMYVHAADTPQAQNSKTTFAPFLLEKYQGRTLLERIQQDNAELSLVLQRYRGQLSAQNFAVRILQHYQTSGHSIPLAHALTAAVEEEVKAASLIKKDSNSNSNTTTTPPSHPLSLSPTHVQVFILENLFRPHPTTNQSAIQGAYNLLRETPLHVPVAWGNTNSKPRDYQMVLEIACQSRRPVHFLIQGREIPSVELSQLLQRNLRRFSETGKYIPAVAIDDCQGRVSKLIQGGPGCGGGNHHNTTTVTVNDTLALDQYLVGLAEPRGNHYRYRLTGNRLIHKEFGRNNHDAAPSKQYANRGGRDTRGPYSDAGQRNSKRPRWR